MSVDRFSYRLAAQVISYCSYWLLLGIALLFCPLRLQAGDYTDTYYVSHYTTENGLPQSSVKAIAVGDVGFVWLATEAGLVRFDGNDFIVLNKTNTSMPTTRVISFERAGSNGRLQALLEESNYLEIYRGRTQGACMDEWKLFPALTYTPRSYQLLPLAWAYQNATDIFGFRKAKYNIGSYNTLCINYDICKAFWYQSRTRKMSAYNIPALQPAHYLCAIDNEAYVPLLKQHQLRAIRFNEQKMDTVAIKGALTQDPDWSETVFINNTAMNQTFAYTAKGLYQLKREEDGSLSAHLLLGGFDCLTNRITSVYHDEAKNRIFIGSNFNGLYVLNRKAFRTMINAEATNMSGNVYYHHVPLNTHTVVTGKGVRFSIHPDGVQQVPLFDQFKVASNFGCYVYRDTSGRIWIGGARVLGYTDTSMRYMHRQWYIHGKPTAIQPIRPDLYWVGMDNGDVYTVNPLSTNAPVKMMNLDTHVFCLLRRGQELWIGTAKKLYRYHLQTRKLQVEPRLNGKVVRNFYLEPNGDVWICTYEGGLYLYRNNRFVTFPKDPKKGLNAVHAMVQDHKGFCWISTNTGIYQTRKQDLIDYADKKTTAVMFLKYDRQSGLYTNECNGGGREVAAQLDNGYYTFASMNGIVFFQPDSIQPDLPDADLIVDEVRVNNEVLKISDTLQVDRNFANLMVSVASPYFGDPDNLYIEYRLDHAAWLPVDNHHIPFNQLSAGWHSLELRKRSGFDKQYHYGKVLQIYVPPAYYETLAFRIGLVLLILMAIGLVFYLRLVYHKKRNKELQHAVAERTADLERSIEALTQSEQDMVTQLQFQQQLCNNIAHDIRTPLKYMMIAAEYLSDKVVRGEHPEQSETNDLYLSARRIYSYTDSLTRYLKAKTLSGKEKQPVHIHSLIEQKKETFELAAREKGIDIQNNVCPNYDLLTYPELFDILLHNLLDNAIKYTSHGHIILTNDLSGPVPVLEITDTGSGMSRAQIDLYNRFFDAADNETINGYVGFGFLFMKDAQQLLNLRITLQAVPTGGLRVRLHLLQAPEQT